MPRSDDKRRCQISDRSTEGRGAAAFTAATASSCGLTSIKDVAMGE
jgi:hypothetical protein